MFGFFFPPTLAQLAQIGFNGTVLPAFVVMVMCSRRMLANTIVGYRASAIVLRLSPLP